MAKKMVVGQFKQVRHTGLVIEPRANRRSGSKAMAGVGLKIIRSCAIETAGDARIVKMKTDSPVPKQGACFKWQYQGKMCEPRGGREGE